MFSWSSTELRRARPGAHRLLEGPEGADLGRGEAGADRHLRPAGASPPTPRGAARCRAPEAALQLVSSAWAYLAAGRGVGEAAEKLSAPAAAARRGGRVPDRRAAPAGGHRRGGGRGVDLEH
jgi:hypothetical protein